MICRLCGRRKTRRACPALHEDICAVCCGTKRETEIRCPSSCQYLVSARAHPAAVVRRQQEEDLRVFLPTVRDLSDRQAELLWQIAGFVRHYEGDGLLRTTDLDVEAAAAALAATHETAARGLIYEQRPSSLAAQQFASGLNLFISKIPGDRVSSFDRDLAAVLRAIERGARDAHKALGGDSAYRGLLRRLIVLSQDKPDSAPPTGVVERGGSLLVRP